MTIETQGAIHPASHGLRSTLAGIIVNLCLAAIKGIAGVAGHSYALIADAIESLTDVFSSLVVYFGLRVAMRPPDANHPYGHGKAEPMAAVAVSIALFGAAVAIAFESIHEIRKTPHDACAFYTLVLPVVVVAKETMFRFVNRVGADRKRRGEDRRLASSQRRHHVGIGIRRDIDRAHRRQGWESADDWAALLASGLIALNAYLLLRPAVQELGDALPGTQLHRRFSRSLPQSRCH